MQSYIQAEPARLGRLRRPSRVLLALAAALALLLAYGSTTALASTAPSETIAGAQSLPVVPSGGPTEAGGGDKIDFWRVHLAGGDQLLVNFSGGGCSTHFELYAPTTIDATFTSKPPVVAASICNSGQVQLQAPYDGNFVLAVCENPNDGDCRSADNGTVTDPMSVYKFTLALAGGGISPEAEAGETEPSSNIGGAQLLTVGNIEGGGGEGVDFWRVSLAGGEQLLLNYSEAAGCGMHYELYSPEVTDGSFAMTPPVSVGSSCGGEGQVTLQAPYTGSYLLAICQNPNDGDCRSADTGTVTDPMAPLEFRTELANGGISPQMAAGETRAAGTIAAAQTLTVGNYEAGGGERIDYWRVNLDGGQELELNFSEAGGCGMHYELYAATTTDSTFTSAPPVSSGSSCGSTGQIKLAAPSDGAFVLAVCENPNDGDCRSADTGTVTDPMAPYAFTTSLVAGSETSEATTPLVTTPSIVEGESGNTSPAPTARKARGSTLLVTPRLEQRAGRGIVTLNVTNRAAGWYVEIQAEVRVRNRLVWKTIAEEPSRRLTLHVRADARLRVRFLGAGPHPPVSAWRVLRAA